MQINAKRQFKSTYTERRQYILVPCLYAALNLKASARTNRPGLEKHVSTACVLFRQNHSNGNLTLFVPISLSAWMQ